MHIPSLQPMDYIQPIPHAGMIYQPELSIIQTDGNDERFFGFFPFLAGLVAGPLLLSPFLFNRPCCPPYPPPFPPPVPVPAPYLAGPPFPSPAYQPNPFLSVGTNYGNITENVTITNQLQG